MLNSKRYYSEKWENLQENFVAESHSVVIDFMTTYL